MNNSKECNIERRRVFKGALALAGAGAASQVLAKSTTPQTISSPQFSQEEQKLLALTANELPVIEQKLVQPPLVPKHDQVAKGRP